jgi:hypothetical protein
MELETVLKLKNGTIIDLINIAKIELSWDINEYKVLIYEDKSYYSIVSNHFLSFANSQSYPSFWYPYEKERYVYNENTPEDNINKGIDVGILKPVTVYNKNLNIKIYTAANELLGLEPIGNMNVTVDVDSEEYIESRAKKLTNKAESKMLQIMKYKDDKIISLLANGNDLFKLNMS